MSKPNNLCDDIWALHKSAKELASKVDSLTKEVLSIAIYALETAGSTEASNAEKLRKANESFREWCEQKGQFP